MAGRSEADLTIPSAGGGGALWIAFHLYYHEDLDRILVGLLRPIVMALLREGAVDSFFFVRYDAGGPHLRTRLCVRPEAVESVAEKVAKQADAFFARQPSTRHRDPEAIRRATRELAAEDGADEPATIPPDNSLERAPFDPEIERYGGPDLLAASLGLFALSSVATLVAVERTVIHSRGRRLAEALDLLLGQALGLAGSEEELIRLTTYGDRAWGDRHPKAREQASRNFEQQRESLVAACARQVERRLDLASADPEAPLASLPDPLMAGSLRLSGVLSSTGQERRYRVAWSHLHMSANRLGLRNPEEVYLGGLVSAALIEVSERSPVRWRELGRVLARSRRAVLDPAVLEQGLPSALLAGLGAPLAAGGEPPLNSRLKGRTPGPRS